MRDLPMIRVCGLPVVRMVTVLHIPGLSGSGLSGHSRLVVGRGNTEKLQGRLLEESHIYHDRDSGNAYE
jgi:hypothetical protein